LEIACCKSNGLSDQWLIAIVEALNNHGAAVDWWQSRDAEREVPDRLCKICGDRIVISVTAVIHHDSV
jgi:hypothetical protein